jgi:hypothetical protein
MTTVRRRGRHWHAGWVHARLLALLCAGLVAGLVSGCSGQSADSSCDVEAITDEVGHVVAESGQEITSVDELTCSGDWAVAVAVVGGAGATEAQQTFIVRRGEVGWVLKSAQTACEPGADGIPADLGSRVCADR